MPAARTRDQLVRAARLYYLDGLSQSAVADALGVSRSNVSRILTAARDEGIVQIRVHDDSLGYELDDDLGARLGARFGLGAHVVHEGEPHDLTATVARAAAAGVTEHLPRIHRLGLSWGTTVAQFVEAMRPSPVPANFEVVPLVGGMPSLDTTPTGNTAIQNLARTLGVPPQRLFAPAVVESQQTHDALLGESAIAAAIERAGTVDLAVVGIGSFGVGASRNILEAMRLDDAERMQVDALRPVGDICGRFVTAQGEPIGEPLAGRVVGITFDQLRELPHVLALAAGAEKAPGVLAVLRSGVVRTIVVDTGLASAVLRLAEQ